MGTFSVCLFECKATFASTVHVLLVTRSVCKVNAKLDVDVDATIPPAFHDHVHYARRATSSASCSRQFTTCTSNKLNACMQVMAIAVDKRKELSGAQTKKGSSLSYGRVRNDKNESQRIWYSTAVTHNTT